MGASGSGVATSTSARSLEPTREDGNNVNLDHEVISNIDTGLRYQLVTRAVEDARRDGVKITPLCPFAAAQFRRHPEWSDVLAK